MGRLSFFQRLVNRIGQPFGIKLYSVAFESSLPEAGHGPEAVFNAVYAANYWGSEESRSGAGSEVQFTARYRDQLVGALRRLGVKSMFDAPCGDLNWMPLVLDQVKLAYVGGDVAEQAVTVARQRRPQLDIRLFDMCADEFPDVELWHCRDALFHLSFADIERVFERAARADIKFAAITTHRARRLRNLDVGTGGFRLLDLERAPFNFAKPLMYLKDHASGEFPRFVGIWEMDVIRAAVKRGLQAA